MSGLQRRHLGHCLIWPRSFLSSVCTLLLPCKGEGLWVFREREVQREMGRVFTVELDGRVYSCKFCRTHLALADDLMSRSFHCRRGKAYLFNSVANVSVGYQEERLMLSGMHTVADIYCCCCGQNVGWKYEAAQEKDQKYKEGKFILERGRIIDAVDAEFYIDTRPNGSDAEEM